VYTSGVYSVCGGTRQFTVNVAGERQRRGLQLRGDILLKCYHRHYNPVPTGSPSTPSPAAAATERPQRELVFACQFHTCAVTDYTLSFTRQELDSACSGQYPHRGPLYFGEKSISTLTVWTVLHDYCNYVIYMVYLFTSREIWWKGCNSMVEN
jgi:hypothetical protein